MTVAHELVPASSTNAEWFRHVGTTSPGAALGVRKFIVGVFITGCATTGTLTAVTPADALDLNTVVIQPSTLPAVPVPVPRVSASNGVGIPEMLQRLRRTSGLNWSDIGHAVGVSRRTVHNWLGGAHVAGIHLTRLLELSRTVDLVATGSPESTRTALLQPASNGRSIIEDLALTGRPARLRPISTISVGDLIAPTNEPETVGSARPHRSSTLRGGPLLGRRPSES